MTDQISRGETLRQLITAPGTLVVPGVYDAVSAKLVQRAGFSCAYMSGSGISMSGIGLPDIGLASFAEVVTRLGVIADATALPVIADGDTGYGGVLNVVRTVREFERHGAAAVQLEDQVFPKRCGHEEGRRCIPAADMVDKLHAAADSRRSDDFLIVARTDARTSEGLDAAIERANLYAEAGADVTFVESPESVEEMRAIRAGVNAPLLANMVEGGWTPLLSRAELTEIGFNVAIFPNALLRFVCKQAEAFLDRFRETGETVSALPQMYSHGELFALFDFPAWAEREKQYTHT
ncbi:MAG TPA: oxaloacetate decarboxylase [Trebonia sp.]|jgi:carboxyvinyl-carboxyphosphonate phosphorylmutase